MGLLWVRETNHLKLCIDELTVPNATFSACKPEIDPKKKKKKKLRGMNESKFVQKCDTPIYSYGAEAEAGLFGKRKTLIIITIV